MYKLKYHIILFLFCLFLVSASCGIGEIHNQSNDLREVGNSSSQQLHKRSNDDFYFVHITDTHIIHKIYDPGEVTTTIFKTVIEEVVSFPESPDFIVITGDLVEWGGSGPSGALNYMALVDCLYQNNDQFYADENYTIPVYMTPGNHDYNFNRNLNNYHQFITEFGRYVVTHNDVCLFFMDSGPNYYAEPTKWFDILGDGLYDEDIQWLDEMLQQCISQHKIVLMHHPAVNDRNEQGQMKSVLARNRETFISLCESYDVELVLAGHTHRNRVFDGDETRYYDFPINCSQHSTLFVQTADCKKGCNYRNISFINGDLYIEDIVELQVSNIQNVKETGVSQSVLLSYYVSAISPLNRKLLLQNYQPIRV
jgi:3',5'-cyclic AMP phosphodiesterase CpdA